MGFPVLNATGSNPVLVVGAGPAGLMAAEQLTKAGIAVHVCDAMPSVGRKFLRAGIGGLNLTHAEDAQSFHSRYSHSQSDVVGADGKGVETVSSWLQDFDADALRHWAQQLGVETFVGSSGRVFPVGLKAAPLLRAWLHRLREQGCVLHTRWRWLGFAKAPSAAAQARASYTLLFETPEGAQKVSAQVVIFALGGGSWARLGSDGRWLPVLARAGVACAPLKPANCGFDYAWSARLLEQFAGSPLKPVGLTVQDARGQIVFSRKGEALVSRHGIQGSLIYAASRYIRDLIDREGEARIYWDLLPDRTLAQAQAALRTPRGKDSLSNWLRKRLGLEGVRLSLFHELAGKSGSDAEQLAALLKQLPQSLHQARPIDEAISTAGGVLLNALDDQLMSVVNPGIFFAGEMLDWEAPTGGYLLNACFASGLRAGQGAVAWLQATGKPLD
ncbi:MAG: TIGR03862 family flavoprotein [Gammaproteobacteria bacterium]|nr:TIGR03862 family flavoprotein [Gammaproteobacteria bacterium]